MAIRFKSVDSSLGAVRGHMEDLAGQFLGSVSFAPTRTGVMASNLDTVAAFFSGNYQLNSSRVGIIDATLDQVVASLRGPALAATFVIRNNANGGQDFDGNATSHPGATGPNRAVQVGDIIEFEAGVHSPRRISDVQGSPGNYITVRGPTNGQAIFRNPNSASSTSGTQIVEWRNCRYIRVDAYTNVHSSVTPAIDGKRHSILITIKANATPSNRDTPGHFFKLSGNDGSATYTVTRDIHVLGVHCLGGWDVNDANSLSNTAGIGLSSNDHGFKRADYPGAWQENMIWEHVLTEKIGGEGTYFGPNPYLSVRGTGSEAGGADVGLRYIIVRYSMFHTHGGNGVSLKSVFEGLPGGDAAGRNSVHHCVFIACGLDPGANGLIACTLNSSRAAVYNCWFESCAGGAININVSEGTNVGFQGSSATFPVKFFNNVISNCSGSNMINTLLYSGANGGPIPQSWAGRVRCFSNTFNNNAGTDINMSNANADGFVRHNLLPGGSINYGPYPSSGTNITSGTAAATFVDATGTWLGGNINLRPSSAKLTNGTMGVGAVENWGDSVDLPNFDFADNPRSAGTCDAGAYEFGV